MAVTPDELYARVLQAADHEGRLRLSRMTGWDIFPFGQDGLRVVPLTPPQLPEPDRHGENGRPCQACNEPGAAVW